MQEYLYFISIILHLSTNNLDDMIYSSWGIVWQTEIGNYRSFFVLLASPPHLKMQKIAGDIIILHMCTKTHNHMRHGWWNTEWDRQNVVILGHFLPFYLPNNLENQNFEKMTKASGDVIVLHMCTTNHNHMMYASWDVACDRHVLSFWAIFCPFSPLTTWKIKNAWRCYHFTIVYHKWQSYDVWFLRYGVQQKYFFVILDHFLPI